MKNLFRHQLSESFHIQFQPSPDANRSTDSMDNESLADRIDVLAETEQNLKNLNEEIMDEFESRIGKDLKVDIKDSSSRLRMRDDNGKVIGKLKDGEKVTFLRDSKLTKDSSGQDGQTPDDHLWLKVEYTDSKGEGKKGWVSAEYLKGFISNPKPEEQTEPVPTPTPEQDPKPEEKPEEETPTVPGSEPQEESPVSGEEETEPEEEVVPVTPTVPNDISEVIPANSPEQNDKLLELSIKDKLPDRLEPRWQRFSSDIAESSKNFVFSGTKTELLTFESFLKMSDSFWKGYQLTEDDVNLFSSKMKNDVFDTHQMNFHKEGDKFEVDGTGWFSDEQFSSVEGFLDWLKTK